MDTNQLREQEARNCMLYVFRHLDEDTSYRMATELRYAFEKHPKFPKRKKSGLAIISEEYGELAVAFTKLCQGVNDKETIANLKEEAAQVAVTAIRFLEALEK